MSEEERSVEPTVGEERPETLARLHQIQEQTILRGLTKFKEVGAALMWIRNNKTYHTVENYKTFEGYCREKWDMVASRGRQLISAARVSRNLESVTIVAPVNECQVRPLVGLEPDQQRDAWDRAVETAEGERPTGRQVQQIVKAMKKEAEAEKEGKGANPEAEVQARVEKLEAAAAMVQKQSKKMLKSFAVIDEAIKGEVQLSGEGAQCLREELKVLHDHVGALMEKLNEVEEDNLVPDGEEHEVDEDEVDEDEVDEDEVDEEDVVDEE